MNKHSRILGVAGTLFDGNLHASWHKDDGNVGYVVFDWTDNDVKAVKTLKFEEPFIKAFWIGTKEEMSTTGVYMQKESYIAGQARDLRNKAGLDFKPA